MNYSITNRRALGFIAFLLGVFSIKAQVIKADSIFWNNGNVSLLNELGKVWIIRKKGNDIKDVRIVEIKKEKGTLVYEKEKCLHDVAINTIEKIQAGKFSVSGMYFHPDNTPFINREIIYPDPFVDYSDFTSLKIKKTKPEIKAISTMTIPPINEEISCDTLIEENGYRLLVKIVSVDSKFLYYKQIKHPSGPIYVKCSDKAVVRRYSKCTTVNFFK